MKKKLYKIVSYTQAQTHIHTNPSKDNSWDKTESLLGSVFYGKGEKYKGKDSSEWS